MERKKLKMGAYVAPVVIPAILTLATFLSAQFSAALGGFMLALFPALPMGIATALGVGLALLVAALVGVAVCFILSEVINRVWFGTELDQSVWEYSIDIAENLSKEYANADKISSSLSSEEQADTISTSLLKASVDAKKAKDAKDDTRLKYPHYEMKRHAAVKDYATAIDYFNTNGNDDLPYHPFYDRGSLLKRFIRWLNKPTAYDAFDGKIKFINKK